MKLSSTAFRLMARRDAAGVRLLTHNGLDWSPCQPRPDLQSSWRRLVRGIGATSMPNVLSDLPCCHPNSTAKKISGNSCGRTGCRTEFSNPSTTSSITAATPGTRSSISRGKSCPSPAAIGQPQVTQFEDWYNPFCRLFEGGAALAKDPVRPLQDVDDLGKRPRLHRDVPMRLSVAYDPIPRRHQAGFVDPGRDDLGRNRVAHPTEDFSNLISR